MIEEKEQEIEALLQDLDLRDSDHAAALKELEEDFKGDIEDAKSREAEARDVSCPSRANGEQITDASFRSFSRTRKKKSRN